MFIGVDGKGRAGGSVGRIAPSRSARPRAGVGSRAGLVAQAGRPLPGQIIHVRHSLTAWDELKGPKTKHGIRDVVMPRYVAELLREWISKFYLPNERQLIFRLAKGGPVGSSTFHMSLWKPLLRRAGLFAGDGNEYHFHALRHFNA